MSGASASNGQTARPGDWTCPACGDLVFASRSACKMCGTIKPAERGMGGMGGMACMGGMGGMGGGMGGGCYGPAPSKGKGKGSTKGARPGDWICPNPECGDLVFGSRDACKLCGTPKSALTEGASGAQGKSRPRPGDWECPACSHMNMSKNQTCENCGASAEGAKRTGAKPGDWVCPACGDLVFASKSACKMCGAAKPDDAEEVV